VKKNKLLLYLLAAVFIALVFKSWFLPFPLSTGDWSYKFPKMISEFNLYPYAWNTSFGNGFGTNGIFLMALGTYFSTSAAFLYKLNIPWVFIEKILWYWPFIIVSSLGSFFLFKQLFTKSNTYAAVSSLIFTANTYSLMIVGGGQMGVGMGYAMIPLVFFSFISILKKVNSSKNLITISTFAGIVFSIQLLLDLRIAYVTMLFIGLYYLLSLLLNKSIGLKKTILPYVFWPTALTLLLHFFWVVPFMILGQNPLEKLGEQFSGIGIIEFLSFAKFENTLSLLHPNWPENLFGKAYFMRPEFILLPILVFSNLFFLKKDPNKDKILTLSLIALIGAFLAKGSNEPFGQLYVWAFGKIPGFMMFRDSTKWYGVVALSYSLLIPYFLFLASKIEFKKIKMPQNALVIIFIVFWVFTIRQVFTGELKGTFTPKKEPQNYVKLADFLSSQGGFFRTLWVPSLHQYTYYSDVHPAVSAADYFSAYSSGEISDKLSANLRFLADAGIKYVIVPEDTEGKIFTDDRKYSEEVYDRTVKDINNVEGLGEVGRFGKIKVFEVPGAKDHFWSPSTTLRINYKYINPTRYELTVHDAKKGDVIIFSESYDAFWFTRKIEPNNPGKIEIGSAIQSNLYKRRLNSFILREDGDYKLEIFYLPQKWVDLTLIVSSITLLIIVSIFAFRFIKT